MTVCVIAFLFFPCVYRYRRSIRYSYRCNLYCCADYYLSGGSCLREWNELVSHVLTCMLAYMHSGTNDAHSQIHTTLFISVGIYEWICVSLLPSFQLPSSMFSCMHQWWCLYFTVDLYLYITVDWKLLPNT